MLRPSSYNSNEPLEAIPRESEKVLHKNNGVCVLTKIYEVAARLAGSLGDRPLRLKNHRIATWGAGNAILPHPPP